MDLQNNSLENRNEIAQFLEKFKEPSFPSSETMDDMHVAPEIPNLTKSFQYKKTFEKLEQKIEELEARFEASAGQNQLILAELARQREALANQKDRDAFVEHLSHTIANLKASVENLSRVPQPYPPVFPSADVQRGFDTVPNSSYASNYGMDNYRAFQQQRQQAAAEERERIIASLHQKASQLKAVNSALDREIKKVQQEKLAALKKSAEQAKEILSLREQLSAAEEKFKSFDFEGRIISIRQEYEQKVNSLETQLQEISATCMKQVEEIESLRAQNIKLQRAVEEKEQVQSYLKAKEAEVSALKEKIARLEQDREEISKQQLSVFAERLRQLETQRDELAVKLKEAQSALEGVRAEKELLEKKFQELIEKINQNDAVIAQLKQKIDVLGQQNQTLSQQNAQLAGEKTRWEDEKISYQMRARSAEQDREVLISRTEALAHAKQTVEAQVEKLAQTNAALMQEKQSAQAQVRQLSDEKETLAKQAEQFQHKTNFLLNEKAALNEENQQLRNQSAALLAARLVQDKNHRSNENTVPKETAEKKQTLPDHQPEKPVTSVEEAPLFDGPVTITERAKASVTTSADLPEIKVAEPVPQPQPVFDGEDFLEKTDSFIGRMKWSLFREDK